MFSRKLQSFKNSQESSDTNLSGLLALLQEIMSSATDLANSGGSQDDTDNSMNPVEGTTQSSQS